MAIYKPGERHRYHRILSKKGGKRGVTATLSLTAMVDMFTVLVIFLLQSYSTTGEILYMPKEIVLPKANRVNELKPSVVVTISSKEVLIDRTRVASYQEAVAATDWSIPALRDQLKVILDKARTDQESKFQNKIKNAVDKTLGKQETEDLNAWRKVTLQADKDIDYLTMKKIMYSIYEAGGGPINFAVAKDTDKPNAAEQNKTQ